MPASEAQIRANQQNAARSTGPKTSEGKEASRANAVTHGLTACVVSIACEAVAADRRHKEFREDFQITTAAADLIAMRAAVLSARMERCVEHETAAISDRIHRAQLDFVPPEGVSEAEAARLRIEAGKLALFDPSKEATLARKYEAAAERGFLRCIKELRAIQKEERVAREAAIDRELASFSPAGLTDDEFDALSVKMGLPPLPKLTSRPERGDFADLKGRVDVPFSIGKPR